MFKFLFIKRHENNVLKYIASVFSQSESRTDLKTLKTPLKDVDRTQESSTVKYSDRGGDESKEPSETKYSDRYYPDKEETVRYSDRDEPKSEDKPKIKYSLKDDPFDEYDPDLVARVMKKYLRDKTPPESLSSTTNITFVQKLEQHIRNKNLASADVYKAALMDRRLFSKIVCDTHYKPSKDTALALIFALRLNLSEANDMLERAGYTLSHSIRRDIIIEYFIKEGVYNLNNINAFLYNMNEKIIGKNY